MPSLHNTQLSFSAEKEDVGVAKKGVSDGRKESGINHHRLEHHPGVHCAPSTSHFSFTDGEEKECLQLRRIRCNIVSPPLICFPWWRRARRGRSGREDSSREGRGELREGKGARGRRVLPDHLGGDPQAKRG